MHSSEGGSPPRKTCGGGERVPRPPPQADEDESEQALPSTPGLRPALPALWAGSQIAREPKPVGQVLRAKRRRPAKDVRLAPCCACTLCRLSSASRLPCSHWRPHGARARSPGARDGPGAGPGPARGACHRLRVPRPGRAPDLHAGGPSSVAGPSGTRARATGSPVQHRAPLPLFSAAQPLPCR